MDRSREDAQPVVVHRCYTDAEAGMVRSLLESYGIPCSVESDITHVAYPLTVDGLGEVRVCVPPGAAEEARAILDSHRGEGAEPDRLAEGEE